jgi:outer membrane lipoprotein SlyB
MTLANRFFSRLAALCAAVILTACASGGPQTPAISGTGVVSSISETTETSSGKTAMTSVLGSLVGGALGSTIGGGTGQVIATTVGATAGSVAGANMAQRSAATVWDVSIRFDDGINRVVRVRDMPNFRPGDKVRVVNGAVSLL